MGAGGDPEQSGRFHTSWRSPQQLTARTHLERVTIGFSTIQVLPYERIQQLSPLELR